MANTIKIRRSGVPGKVPDTSISVGELGLNYADGVLYFKVIQDGAEKLFRLVGDELIGAFASNFGSLSQSQQSTDYGLIAQSATIKLDYGSVS
jgi:hypothetical protein